MARDTRTPVDGDPENDGYDDEHDDAVDDRVIEAQIIDELDQLRHYGDDTGERFKVMSKKEIGAFFKTFRKELQRVHDRFNPIHARFLVDSYYRMQKTRIRAKQQAERCVEAGDPHRLLLQFWDFSEIMEKIAYCSLRKFANRYSVGVGAQEIVGIGPIMTSGLLSNLDIRVQPLPTGFWDRCGLNPDNHRRTRGQKLHYNPDLKRLCFLIGTSFAINHKREHDVYGRVYLERKAYEAQIDSNCGYKELCLETLRIKPGMGRKVKEIYESYHLPKGRLELRARRYAVKRFISHLHHAMYLDFYGKDPSLPYAFSDPARRRWSTRHVHYQPPPPDMLRPIRRREGEPLSVLYAHAPIPLTRRSIDGRPPTIVDG